MFITVLTMLSNKYIFTRNVFLYLFHLCICISACKRGFFGENCNHKCVDKCDDCNDEDGLCDNGCLPGWTGYFCQNSNFKVQVSFSDHLLSFVRLSVWKLFRDMNSSLERLGQSKPYLEQSILMGRVI